MKATMLATLAVSSITLVGCGEPRLVWVHEDKESHNFLQDRDTCSARVDTMDVNYKAIFDRCMNNLGWEQKELD